LYADGLGPSGVELFFFYFFASVMGTGAALALCAGFVWKRETRPEQPTQYIDAIAVQEDWNIPEGEGVAAPSDPTAATPAAQV
jgi:hypothetical protein